MHVNDLPRSVTVNDDDFLRRALDLDDHLTRHLTDDEGLAGKAAIQPVAAAGPRASSAATASRRRRSRS